MRTIEICVYCKEIYERRPYGSTYATEILWECTLNRDDVIDFLDNDENECGPHCPGYTPEEGR